MFYSYHYNISINTHKLDIITLVLIPLIQIEQNLIYIKYIYSYQI